MSLKPIEVKVYLMFYPILMMFPAVWDYCRFFYNVKFNILVWFDWLQFRAWNLEWSQMWACWEGTTKARHAHKCLRGKNEGVQGGAERGGELWVNGCLFISSFPHPVSCKDGHPIWKNAWNAPILPVALWWGSQRRSIVRQIKYLQKSTSWIYLQPTNFSV